MKSKTASKNKSLGGYHLTHHKVLCKPDLKDLFTVAEDYPSLVDSVLEAYREAERPTLVSFKN